MPWRFRPPIFDPYGAQSLRVASLWPEAGLRLVCAKLVLSGVQQLGVLIDRFFPSGSTSSMANENRTCRQKDQHFFSPQPTAVG